MPMKSFQYPQSPTDIGSVAQLIRKRLYFEDPEQFSRLELNGKRASDFAPRYPVFLYPYGLTRTRRYGENRESCASYVENTHTE
eukprot:IDg9466t1